MKALCEIEVKFPGLSSEMFKAVENYINTLLDDMVLIGLARSRAEAGAILKAQIFSRRFDEMQLVYRTLGPNFNKLPNLIPGLASLHVKFHIEEFIPKIRSDNKQDPCTQFAIATINQILSKDPEFQFFSHLRHSDTAYTLREDEN